jgi:predicted patatin/cPLA2 family phospholipase
MAEHNHKQDPVRALVISGGGSKGAFAGGISDFLLNECHHDYQIFIGTSAGSLLVPLLALGETERLKKVFTTIRQHDIFSINPFIIRRKGGRFTYRINHFNTLWMFLRGKKTFGESESLVSTASCSNKLVSTILTWATSKGCAAK